MSKEYNSQYLEKAASRTDDLFAKALQDYKVQKIASEPAQKPIPRAIEEARTPENVNNTDERNAIQDTALQVIGGARDAAQEVIDGADTLGQWLDKNVLGLGGLQIFDKDGNIDLELQSSQEFLEAKDLGAGTIALPEVDQPNSIVGGLSRGISQFLAGFVPAAKALKIGQASTKAGKITKGIGASAIADFTVFDPHAERLSNFIQEFPVLRNPVSQFLAADVNDGEVEGRLKNVLEGLGLDALTAGAFVGASKAIRSAKNLSGKSGQQIDEAIDQVDAGDIEKAKSILDEDKPASNLFGDTEAPISQVKTTKKKKRSGTTKETLKDTEGKPKEFELSVESELGDKALNINLARLNTSDDVKQIIDDASKAFKSEFEIAARGVQSNKLTEQLADDLGMSVGDLLSRRQGETFNAEQALAARKILVSSADNLRKLAEQVRSPEVSDADRIKFRRALSVHAAIQQQVTGFTREAGRALQAFRISAGSSAEQAKNIRDILDSTGGSGTADDLAQAVLETSNSRQLNRLASKAYNANGWSMLLEYWMNSILSGATTHMVNISGNSINALLQIPERLGAAGFSRALGSKDGIDIGEAMAMSKGLFDGIVDGWRLAKHAFKTEGIEDPLTKIETADRRAITAANVSKTFLGRTAIDPSLKILGAKTLSEGGLAANFVDGLGSAIRIPGYRMLSSEDAFFKGLNYRMELHAQAYRQANSEGLTGRALAERVASIVDNPPSSLRIAAIDSADVNTFTNYNKMASGLNRIINSFPPLRMMVPFVRTPSNIIRFAYHRTPFAALWGQAKEDILAGGSRRDLALSRISIGSSAMAAASYLALQGQITGSAPKDPGLRKIWLEENQEYSFVTTLPNGKKEFTSYNRFEPIGMLFGFSADYANLISSIGDREAEELIGMAALAFSNNVTSKTWLKGVSDALDMLNDPERTGGRYVSNLLSSVVPNLVNQTNRAFNDPYLRDLDGTLDAIKARIPGFSDDLPARRSLWGEPIEPRQNYTDELGQQVFNLLSPAYKMIADNDPVNNEILDNNISIRLPKRYLNISGLNEPVPLDAYDYNRFIELAGKPAKRELDRIVTKQKYQRLSNGSEGEKAALIKKVITQYRKLAKQELIKTSPNLQQKIRNQQDQQILQSFTQGN